MYYKATSAIAVIRFNRLKGYILFYLSMSLFQFGLLMLKWFVSFRLLNDSASVRFFHK